MPQTTLLRFLKPLELDTSRNCIQTLASPPPMRSESHNHVDEQGTRESLQLAGPTMQAVLAMQTNTSDKSGAFVLSSHPDAAIVRIHQSHLPRLKAITRTLLPVKYPDKFFNECTQDTTVGDFCRVLLWNSQPVGWIRCRLEPGRNDRNQLYIQAVGILAPYRGYGLASALLDHVLHPELISHYNIGSVFAHVWQSNELAMDWYLKMNFKRVLFEEHYYKRLRPAGAWIVRKDVT